MLEGTEILLQTRQTYDVNSNLTSQTFYVKDANNTVTSYTEYYTYNKKDGTLNTYTTGNGHTMTMVYDELKRVKQVSAPICGGWSYEYRDISDTQTTTQVFSMWYGNSKESTPFWYDYTYDSVGNIATYNDGGTT